MRFVQLRTRQHLFEMMFIVLLPQLLVNNEMQQPEVSTLYWFTLGSLLLVNGKGQLFRGRGGGRGPHNLPGQLGKRREYHEDSFP